MTELSGSDMAAQEALKLPFHSSEIKWRPSSFDKGKSAVLLYVDARNVMDRLDTIVSPHRWKTSYSDNGDRCCCTLSILWGDTWIQKADVGTPSSFEGIKGMYSDAFKRAAVHHGIGRYLYDDKVVEGKFATGQSGFTDQANAEILEQVQKHYGNFGGNYRERIASVMFEVCPTLAILKAHRKANSELLDELKKDDSAAFKRVQEVYKRKKAALTAMEEA
jgi:hypothetical protein